MRYIGSMKTIKQKFTILCILTLGCFPLNNLFSNETSRIFQDGLPICQNGVSGTMSLPSGSQQIQVAFQSGSYATSAIQAIQTGGTWSAWVDAAHTQNVEANPKVPSATDQNRQYSSLSSEGQGFVDRSMAYVALQNAVALIIGGIDRNNYCNLSSSIRNKILTDAGNLDKNANDYYSSSVSLPSGATTAQIADANSRIDAEGMNFLRNISQLITDLGY